ncbi:hypothetical protein BO443_10098 [Burkholderia orbicola]
MPTSRARAAPNETGGQAARRFIRPRCTASRDRRGFAGRRSA